MEHLSKLARITDNTFTIYWGRDRVGWVASKDIGAAAACVLREGPAKHAGKDYWLSVEVAGGEELATLFSEVLGRQIRCEYRHPEEFPINEEAEPWYAAGALEFLRQFQNGHMGDLGMIRDDTPYLLDQPALTLREWLQLNRTVLA